MSTPRYIARPIAGDYELVRADASHQVNRSLLTIFGFSLTLGGLARRSPLGAALAVVGGGLLYAGLMGKNPLAEYLTSCSACGDWPGPSDQHGRRVQRMQSPGDAVEEASMASFPASDPPAHSPQVGNGRRAV